jgi:hypothetical protein
MQRLEEKMGFLVVKSETNAQEVEQLNEQVESFIKWKSDEVNGLGKIVEHFWLTMKSIEFMKIPVLQDHTKRYCKKLDQKPKK